MGKVINRSMLKKVFAKEHKTTEKIIFIKNKTANIIRNGAQRVKLFACFCIDKTAVFFDSLKYESKGLLFNGYDRMRFFLSQLPFDNDIDLIEYKGEPEPDRIKVMKNSVREKMDNIKEGLPGSFTEFKSTIRKYIWTSKRKIRMARALIMNSCQESFYLTKDYVMGIRKSTVAGLSAIVIGGFALTFLLTTIAGSYAIGVTINGERVGFVESEEQLAIMVEDVEKQLSSENYNADVQIKEDLIKVDSMAEQKNEVAMMDEDTLKNTVVNAHVITATAAAIKVDGNPVLYVGTTEDAETVLNQIKQKYNVAGEDVIIEFSQDVSIEETSVNVDDLMPTKNAITYLQTGNEVIKQYKVKEDDTDWDIAVANGLTEKELQKANPQLDTEVIKEGDILNISKMTPYVDTEVIATVNVTEKTDYKTKKIKTDTLYTGESEVKEEGKRGEVSVTKRAVYVNGKEENSQLIEKKVISEPTKRVILVGTAEKPEANSSSGSSSSGSSQYKSGGGSYISGSGTLSNPMRNMELSSPFGMRNGRMHAGADFRNPAGTAIYAAASGTVTYSGYDGAYGNTVRISHGNGMTTVYAHCTSLYVKSGAKVSKGQQIATVGRTGRATGNHLHFEVRINGSPQNPLNYL